MTLSLTQTDQYLIKKSINWENFKMLQAAFEQIGGIRLTYWEGVLEIMGIGKLHEKIVTLLTGLLLTYFTFKKIKFFSTGAYTQSIEGITEFQADLSFNFDTEKENSDLCIEVVITSDSPAKLRKYQLKNIPEVWFWEQGKISIYLWKNGEYMQVTSSYLLPDLDILHLENCLLMASQLEAMLAMQAKYRTPL